MWHRDRLKHSVLTLDNAMRDVADAAPLQPLAHGFTHFRLQIRPRLLETVETPPHEVLERDDVCWYDPAAPARLGLAAPVTELIESLSAGCR